MQTSDSIVIIPTYNERENIENIIRAVFGISQSIPYSGNRRRLSGRNGNHRKTFATRISRTAFMIERKGKLGLGTAYITGFKWALEHAYEYIFEMDADFSHNPNDLPRLYRGLFGTGWRCIHRLPATSAE